ncbi:MAG: hypothetical protein QMD80_07145 [archaeon]|nr:hypothetical protein [archaeon]
MNISRITKCRMMAMESGMLADAMNEIRRFWKVGESKNKCDSLSCSEKRGDVNHALE